MSVKACVICGRMREVKDLRDPLMCFTCKCMHAIFFAEPLGEWAKEALCAETDPDLFFADQSGVGAVRAAKAVCAKCPVARECFEYAMKNKVPYGVWGGTTAKERQRARSTAAARRKAGSGSHDDDTTPEAA